MLHYLDLKSLTALHGDEISRAAERVVRSGWYLRGCETREFERNYAEYIGTKHCIGCANGLDALTLIVRAYQELGVMRRGDEIIVPANTYIASILAVTRCGMKAVLVEPREDTLQIDPGRIEEAITPRTRAVMIVHLYGRCAYTDEIGGICKKHGLKLIEDNAQAHGSRFECKEQNSSLSTLHSSLKLTGSLGDAAGHSFYPGKNLGCLGDGGAVTTDDDGLAEVVRTLANYGSSVKYVFPYEGMNSRLDEIQAAVVSVKLPYLDRENARRREIAGLYLEEIDNPLVTLPYRSKAGECADARERISGESACNRELMTDNVFHVFPVFCDDRDRLQQYLRDNGVETIIHYPIPPHRQGCYERRTITRDTSCPEGITGDTSATLVVPSGGLPVTERIHRRELSLPCNQLMTDDDARRVIELVNAFE